MIWLRLAALAMQVGVWCARRAGSKPVPEEYAVYYMTINLAAIARLR